MYKKLITATILTCTTLLAFAQQGSPSIAQPDKGVFGSPVMPGPNGTYIYTADTNGRMHRPTPTNVYTLYKGTGTSLKPIATLTFPSSTAELEKRLGKDLLQNILTRQKLHSADDLYTQLKAGRLDTLGVFSSSLAVQQAMGALFIDTKQTKADPAVSYRLDLTVNGSTPNGNTPNGSTPNGNTPNGNTHTVYQIALGNIRYTPMPVFRRYGQTASDSVAVVIWYAANIHLPLRPQDPKAAFATIFTTGASQKNYTAGARQYVYTKRDTLFVSYSIRTTPGTKLSLYMRPEDLPGNRGPISDTFHLLALSFRNTLTISHLTGIDTLGAVLLKWDSLPHKAWCSGIEVLKSRDAVSGFVVIDTLPVTATTYRDRRTINGNFYYYQLRPIYFDLPQHGRVTPVIIAVQTKNTTHKIPAPHGLELGLTPNNDIRLHWLPNTDLDVFGYYILRGTARNKMEVISPPLRDTMYIDSLKGLNSGVTYLYAVAAVSMNMTWGDTSTTVGIQSPNAKLLTAPGGIQARATATGIRLSFDDVHPADPAVSGYVVYRRKKGDQYFTPITNPPLTGTHFTDTTALATGIYEYACSSIDAYNHVSLLSPLTEVNPGAATSLFPPADFVLRNNTTGIEISVPASVTATAAPTYIIYRRTVTEKQYQKIGTLTNNTYIDKSAIKDQLYAYAIALQANNTESGKSREKSIRRK